MDVDALVDAIPKDAGCPTQHAKGRTGDCPGLRRETATRRNVTRGVLCFVRISKVKSMRQIQGFLRDAGIVACPTRRSSACFTVCDRKVPLVFWGTDEPIFVLRFGLIASCAHMQ